ncbi:UDP-N-acetylmuramoyl-L-alanyl-D-glutamate--2,6-diaminopimelate ligase [Polynucleobacter kasalickyi]|uniref:UDP-N-acetylmuramoyl-L-alanyl-D-glutamate--2,6-diaminopimelate ligase n=1 Tax=Polynucleobacter kasalickyi TaxID=1938817 RepID=A0A1W2AF00_9BURK|nr:UDP-N-acetylmuramoyl-L-alanyl-D-glutamate--2,6-diaminopimelate ligase [Polynucleobacter kasalickyi]SMC59031.1 UDP-N-acetylmuramoylalanyl-D-glutamate--2,6-diaminopimelate ligase [Polynucleobacter kasalickyi]
MKFNPKNLSLIFADIENTLYSQVDRAANLSADTRLLAPGDVFMAYPVGFGQGLSDNRMHIPDALAKGVALVLYDSENWSETELLSAREVLGDQRCVPIPNLGKIASEVANRWYSNPSADMEVIGVTGTNGKTTITHWLAQAFGKTQLTAIAGTMGYGHIEELQTTGFTTPDAPRVQRMLAELRDQKYKTVAMEVSSHAIDQGRVDAVQINTAIFSNLSQDHLDYHQNMLAYEAAKFDLFRRSNLKNIILNIDDTTGFAWCQKLLGHTRARIYVYGQAENFQKLSIEQQAKCIPVIYELKTVGRSGMMVKIDSLERSFTLTIPSLGSFNIQNALAVISTLLAYDMPIEKIIKNIEQLKSVPGRMEMINLGDKSAPLSIVDFAHTPDGLAKTLNTLLPIAKQRGGNLICVFGCGGNRDKSKRPVMGKIAADIASKIILTSDNPRHEDPMAIIENILQGISEVQMSKVTILEDRAFAILNAVKTAQMNDVILIAGKGHETTQEVMGKKFPFSDQDHLRLALRRVV